MQRSNKHNTCVTQFQGEPNRSPYHTQYKSNESNSQIKKPQPSFVETQKTSDKLSRQYTDGSPAQSPMNHAQKNESSIFPMTSVQALNYFGNALSQIHKLEIQNLNHVYFINLEQREDFGIGSAIGYRYQIHASLESGSSGMVFKVFDHKRKEFSALKAMVDTEGGILEVAMLKQVRHISGIVKLKDVFVYRKHYCIVLELLSQSLYDMICYPSFKKYDMNLVRQIARCVLITLSQLQVKGIIHCDIKPENLMFTDFDKKSVKIVDMGSSFFEYENIKIFMCKADTTEHLNIDIWSLACVLYEIFMGKPLFPGENEANQIQLFVKVIGMPDINYVKKSERYQELFQQNPLNVLKTGLQSQMKTDDQIFINFLSKCLRWEPKDRPNASELLLDPFID